MSCRTGPLRVGRAFARLFNLCGQEKRHRPSRWSGSSFRPTGGPRRIVFARQGIHATKWPPHAQWAFSRLLKSRAKWARGRTTWLWKTSYFDICGDSWCFVGYLLSKYAVCWEYCIFLRARECRFLSNKRGQNVVNCMVNVDTALVFFARWERRQTIRRRPSPSEWKAPLRVLQGSSPWFRAAGRW